MPVQGVADFIGGFFTNGVFKEILVLIPELVNTLFGFDSRYGLAAFFVIMCLDTGRTFRQGIAALAFTEGLGLAAGAAFSDRLAYQVRYPIQMVLYSVPSLWTLVTSFTS